MNGTALILPFKYTNPNTGDVIALDVSPRYSKLTVNGVVYYFVRETGEFDGTSVAVHQGPILVHDADKN